MKHDDEGAMLIPTSGVGKEVCSYLVGKLGIPQNCISFSVHFSVDKYVVLKMELPATEQPKRDG